MPPTVTTSLTEVLAGLVDRVTFHNSENGFCVLRVKARGQRDLITNLGGLRADVTPHVLCRSFASLAADLGYSEPTIAAMIGT
jgi:hypothetical protein